MASIKGYRDLIIWQKGMELVKHVYLLCDGLPDEERFGLASQLKRSSVSIPSNIAEGYGRRSTGDYIRFLNIALGSAYELESQLELLKILKFNTHAEVDPILNLANEITKMTYSLNQKIKQDK